MEVEFTDNQQLERLETDATFNAGLGPEIVHGYRKVMRFIRSAVDERDFRAMRSRRFEKLKGRRAHQHSLRINKQWRLVIELKAADPNTIVRIVGIEDYH